MLETVRVWGGPVRPYRPANLSTRLATAPWEVSAYWELRRQVFVVEQRLFQATDRDIFDTLALPIVAITQSFGMEDQVVGVVRIYPGEAGVFWGGRLGVNRAHRRHGEVGDGLIKAAVGTARGLGCTEFLATVQQQNVRYFERHHFVVRGEQMLLGRPHALMRAKLEVFPVQVGQNVGSAA